MARSTKRCLGDVCGAFDVTSCATCCTSVFISLQSTTMPRDTDKKLLSKFSSSYSGASVAWKVVCLCL